MVPIGWRQNISALKYVPGFLFIYDKDTTGGSFKTSFHCFLQGQIFTSSNELNQGVYLQLYVLFPYLVPNPPQSLEFPINMEQDSFRNKFPPSLYPHHNWSSSFFTCICLCSRFTQKTSQSKQTCKFDQSCLGIHNMHLQSRMLDFQD